MQLRENRRAFTLIELSIVFVIVGILAGGVLVGKALIRSSELKGVISEFERYRTAVGQFKDQYNGLPGDLANAVSIWGHAAGTAADGLQTACSNRTAVSTGTLTCNGNGDGQIFPNNSGDTAAETFLAWQHLANAGLIEGTYTGVTSGNASTYVPRLGVNIPQSRMSEAGWFFQYYGYFIDDGVRFTANYGNILHFGTIPQTGNSFTNGNALKADEAFAIDTKLDDGKPHLGTILSWRYNVSTRPCTTAAETAYAIDGITKACALLLMTGY